MSFKSSNSGETNSPRQSMLISDTAKEISLVASAASYTLLVKTLELVKSEEDLPLSGGKQIEFLFYMDSAKQMSEIAKNMFELGSSARKEAFDMMEYVDNHTDLFSSGNLTKKDVKAS